MNKYTKVCEMCGKTFETNDSRRKMCSYECQNEKRRLISKEYGGFSYPLNYRDLNIRDVINILVTEKISVSTYLENRDYYVLKFLSCKEVYYESGN